MEHGFLKAPWEVLVRNFRAGHKPLAKEIDNFSSAVTQLVNKISSNQPSEEYVSPAITMESITALENKLTGLKRKLETIRSNDEQSMRRCYYRIRHIQTKSSPPAFSEADEQRDADLMELDPPCTDSQDSPETSDKDAEPNGSGTVHLADVKDESLSEQSNQEIATQARWEKLRLGRALVDYMLREGMYETAEALATTYGIEDIVDMDIFRESRVVVEALRKRDCSEGLRWCAENKRRLQKVQSKLEFRLRLQEFVEHARAERKVDAISYMRKHLSPSNCESERLLDIQRFMALLAFQPSTSCQPYKDMYSERKWLDLESAFKQDNYRLHGLTRESMIEILLKAGLASLKTRKCGTEAERKPNCPTCVEPYLSLAQSLPRGRHENSVLVCSISGDIMDENNPPMALPNGNVYSFKALTKMAEENDGVITDPRSQETARMDELRKCFVM